VPTNTEKLRFKKPQLPDFEMTLKGILRFRLIRSVVYSRGPKYVFV